MNILFTCVGRRNYLLNYFREIISKEDRIFATDMQISAPGMAEADVPIVVPSIYSPDYIPSLMKIIKGNKIDAIISLNDLELPILSENRNKIESLECKLLVSNQRVIDITFDKLKTANFLSSIGLKTPLTFTKKEEFMSAYNKGDIKFPIVIKPRWGSASIGIEFPQTKEEFDLADQLSRIKLKRTILNEVSNADFEHAILYQEKIDGKEYGMDILNDFEGNYVGTFVREKISMRAGETDKAKSVCDNRFEVIGRTISQNLKHIGNLDCDILEQNGSLYVLELNPRFGGGYPFSHEAGAKGVYCYYFWIKGEKDIRSFINYKEGLVYSKCDRLIAVEK
ncbi:ATP-grasp domain-containing protein [Porphyromonas macacae]|uniref:ATP-grasp domain-containing protein n=1 Tax=Porphyromonas macacae TaxID=28115 RepID=UPI0024AE34C1|nr:ATP-grasp domain-containing protein [Porphyromonas macacae]